MKSWIQHPWRVSSRLVRLMFVFSLAAIDYAAGRFHCAHGRLSSMRAEWLQKWSRHALRVFGVTVQSTGTVPSKGLLVSNHVSYLDILVLASLTPAVFVAKAEMRRWPVLGWFVRIAGTVFVKRDRRMQTGQAVDEIEVLLHAGCLVVLFPEGTSSDGKTILPFKSALLAPTRNPVHPLSAGVLQYELVDGDVTEEVCYWKDMTLFPHAINLLSKRSIEALVAFAPLDAAGIDRKSLARQLHSRVLSLKESLGKPVVGAEGLR